jgi:hypothetical protein
MSKRFYLVTLMGLDIIGNNKKKGKEVPYTTNTDGN